MKVKKKVERLLDAHDCLLEKYADVMEKHGHDKAMVYYHAADVVWTLIEDLKKEGKD